MEMSTLKRVTSITCVGAPVTKEPNGMMLVSKRKKDVNILHVNALIRSVIRRIAQVES